MKTLRIDGKDYQVEDQVVDFCLQTLDRADAAEKLIAETKASNVQLKANCDELLAAAGADSREKAVATIAGLKEKAARVDELTAVVQQAEEQRRSADIKALLDQACTDGRLTPAKRKEIESGENPGFSTISKQPETLKIYLDLLPVLPMAKQAAAPAPAMVDPNDPTQGGKRPWDDLTGQEKADLYVTNRGLYEELKAKGK